MKHPGLAEADVDPLLPVGVPSGAFIRPHPLLFWVWVEAEAIEDDTVSCGFVSSWPAVGGFMLVIWRCSGFRLPS